MQRVWLVIRTVALSLIVLIGCAANDDAAEVDCAQFEGRYLGLRSGMQWTFSVRDVDTDKTHEKTQTVFEEEDVPGKPGVRAHRLVTTKPPAYRQESVTILASELL